MTLTGLPNLRRRWFKRAFDVFAASVGIIILCPVMGLVAVAIRLTSPGPVFYASRRVGLGGKPFDMVKFRTMVVGADQQGPLVTAGNDARVTPIGRYLRRSKLDELPTLRNVLKGDMSIVALDLKIRDRPRSIQRLKRVSGRSDLASPVLPHPSIGTKKASSQAPRIWRQLTSSSCRIS